MSSRDVGTASPTETAEVSTIDMVASPARGRAPRGPDLEQPALLQHRDAVRQANASS